MLSEKRGLDYDDVLVTQQPDGRRKKLARSGSKTVPQFFIGASGGVDELQSLGKSGGLDTLPGAAAEN